jgi:hypothetical protein
MNGQPNSKTRQLVAALAVLIVIVAIVTAASLSNKKKTANIVSTSSTASGGGATADPATDADSSGASAGARLSSASFKDGSYTATSSFDTPGGVDDITVSLTLKDNTITTVSARESATDHDSQEYDQLFNGGIESAVVGKKIDELTLSRVAGASLTTEGFNGAIAQIERQAQNG